jgi:ankyrin repeat protein
MENNLMDSHEELFAAIKEGDQATVERLVAEDRSLVNAQDEQGLSAMMTAAYHQKPEIVAFLVKKRAKLNLFEACAIGKVERVKSILKRKPKLLNEFAPDGFQPLGLAAFFGHVEVVRFLLESGAEVNTPSRNGLKVTPLNSAAAGRHYEIAMLLLERDANPNIRQEGDFVPLHSAAMNGQIEMVKLLLQYGADKDLKSLDDKTARDYALENGHKIVAEVLA